MTTSTQARNLREHREQAKAFEAMLLDALASAPAPSMIPLVLAKALDTLDVDDAVYVSAGNLIGQIPHNKLRKRSAGR